MNTRRLTIRDYVKLHLGCSAEEVAMATNSKLTTVRNSLGNGFKDGIYERSKRDDGVTIFCLKPELPFGCHNSLLVTFNERLKEVRQNKINAGIRG